MLVHSCNVIPDVNYRNVRDLLIPSFRRTPFWSMRIPFCQVVPQSLYCARHGISSFSWPHLTHSGQSHAAKPFQPSCTFYTYRIAESPLLTSWKVAWDHQSRKRTQGTSCGLPMSNKVSEGNSSGKLLALDTSDGDDEATAYLMGRWSSSVSAPGKPSNDWLGDWEEVESPSSWVSECLHMVPFHHHQLMPNDIYGHRPRPHGLLPRHWVKKGKTDTAE